jgi:hypothetical protein
LFGVGHRCMPLKPDHYTVEVPVPKSMSL